MTTAINVMKEAHTMAKSWGKENGSYSARLSLAIKKVWAMVKEVAKFDETLKVVTGAVKMAFSAKVEKGETTNKDSRILLKQHKTHKGSYLQLIHRKKSQDYLVIWDDEEGTDKEFFKDKNDAYDLYTSWTKEYDKHYSYKLSLDCNKK